MKGDGGIARTLDRRRRRFGNGFYGFRCDRAVDATRDDAARPVCVFRKRGRPIPEPRSTRLCTGYRVFIRYKLLIHAPLSPLSYFYSLLRSFDATNPSHRVHFIILQFLILHKHPHSAYKNFLPISCPLLTIFKVPTSVTRVAQQHSNPTPTRAAFKTEPLPAQLHYALRFANSGTRLDSTSRGIELFSIPSALNPPPALMHLLC